jgi:hypothetical protein
MPFFLPPSIWARNKPNIGHIAFLCTFYVSLAQAKDIDLKTFYAEAPQAWSKWKAGIMQGFKVEDDFTISKMKVGQTRTSGAKQLDDVDKTIVSSAHSLFCMREDDVLIRILYDDGVTRLKAGNNLYAFSLQKKRPEDPQWLLNNVTKNLAAAREKRLGILRDNISVFQGIMVEREWLDTLIKSQGFEVLSSENVLSDDNKPEFKIQFRSHHAVTPLDTILGGTLWFSPDKFWLLTHYEIQMDAGPPEWRIKGGIVQAKFQYQDLDEYPFLKDAVLAYPDGQRPTWHHYKFGKVSRCDLKPSFRLPAFGIPEAMILDAAASDSSRKWWVVILCLAGIVFFSSALVLRKYAMSRKSE